MLAGTGCDNMLTSEKDAQNLLMEKFCFKKNHEIAVPNITTCHDFWEADLLSMTKSFLLHEFEIKLSRSDFAKEKRIIENCLDDGCKLRRFESLSKQLSENSDLGIAPNYFWYCAPSGVIKEEEIPDYAGLIEFYEFRKEDRINIIKPAPRLHSGKASDKVIYSMMRSLNFRHWKNRGVKV